MTQVSYSDGIVEGFSYDAVGNITKATSPDASLFFSYDGADRMTSLTWQELEKTVRFEYDAAGHRTALIDPEDRRMGYDYDLAGNLTGFTDPDGYETTLGYDLVGRLNSVSYPNGAQEHRDYDEAGQLTSVSTSGADGYLESYTYTYDERGFKTSQVEEDGATTNWAYDDAGRLIRVEYPVEKILSIKAGQETTIERIMAPADRDDEEAVDEGASSMETDEAASLTGEPVASPRVVIAAAGGNQKTPPGQDKPASQPQSSPDDEDKTPPGQTKDPGENTGQGSGNSNNGNGPDRTDRAVPPGLLDKLSGAETKQVTPNYILPVRGWVEYQYDAVGNRERESSDAGSKEFTYDAANRLLQAGEVTYGYDAAGNMVARHDPELGLVSYDYDVDGRLRQVSHEDETGVSYGYVYTEISQIWSRG